MSFPIAATLCCPQPGDWPAYRNLASSHPAELRALGCSSSWCTALQLMIIMNMVAQRAGSAGCVTQVTRLQCCVVNRTCTSRSRRGFGRT